MLYFTDCGVKINIPVAFFYIKGAEKNILVDTGCPAEISKVYHPNDPVSDIQSFEEALAKQGLKPEDIDIVIQTHLHYDHCAKRDRRHNFAKDLRQGAGGKKFSPRKISRVRRSVHGHERRF